MQLAIIRCGAILQLCTLSCNQIHVGYILRAADEGPNGIIIITREIAG